MVSNWRFMADNKGQTDSESETELKKQNQVVDVRHKIKRKAKKNINFLYISI